MRLLLFLMLGALLFAPNLRAQPGDVILGIDGVETMGKVLAITPGTITYRVGNDTLTRPAEGVFLIRYANGTRELVQAARLAGETGSSPLERLSPLERQNRGRADALQHYQPRAAFDNAFVATMLLSGLIGAAVTAGIANKPVAEGALQAPSPELLRDPDYGATYRDQARQTKRRRAWAGYGAGLTVQVLLITLAAGLSQ